MRIKSLFNTLKKGRLLYRSVRYRRGYGVHSPFVYKLITDVIEERNPYYCFQEIERIRKTLFFYEEKVEVFSKGRPVSKTIGQIVRKRAISPKRGALLFRLTNYFKPKRIVQTGVSTGISTLYLTAYAADLQCTVIEKDPGLASIARMAFEKRKEMAVDLRIGNYKELIPRVLETMGGVDFLYFNISNVVVYIFYLFELSFPFFDTESVLVVEGIRKNGTMRAFWRTVLSDPRVSVTIDLYSMGLVFFNNRLHKRNYIVYF